MKYFIDIDNTICIRYESDFTSREAPQNFDFTSPSAPQNFENTGKSGTSILNLFTESFEKYRFSYPIIDRINRVNALYDAGHHITLWTSRGKATGCSDLKKLRELTEEQLSNWGVKYHVLSLGEKPDFDVLIDDKAINVNLLWTQCAPILKKNEQPIKIIDKKWGNEVIFCNNSLYCGKILNFKSGSKGSMHFHLKKTETWYIYKGKIILYYTEPFTGTIITEILQEGDTITHKPGELHRVEALEETQIFEVSTPHSDEDSYRIDLCEPAGL